MPLPRNVLRARRRRALPAAAATVALCATLAGCELFGPDQTPTGDASVSATATGDTAGGTLTTLSVGPVAAWDPQRIGSRQDMAFASRVFVRTLTAYSSSARVDQQSDLTPDLATDTGTASTDLRTWTFTIRDGVKWQDGTPVTCADVKYGVSRTFATKDVTGGPAYALALLDIPKAADGSSTYAGPYVQPTTAALKAGAAAYDKAVTCSGSRVTFRLALPAADFNETVTLPSFAPYPKARDRSKSGTYAVWSTGPYQLQGAWSPGKGGTFVRNPNWSKTSDPVRAAYPDRIRYVEGEETQNVVKQIMADGADGAGAVSLDSAPPALQQQIQASADLQGRWVNPGTGLVDYLAPNFKSAMMAKPQVRQALALATNRDAYVTALGGPTAAVPATSLIPSGLPARSAPSEGQRPVTAGDPVAAAALLAKAGFKGPVPITVAYRSTDTADKAMAALVAGWTKGGFAVTLRPISDDYFTAIANLTMRKVDVFWANWAPEWASAATVLQPLFDSRVNLVGITVGRDYGSFSDAEVNAAMTKVATFSKRDARERAWTDIDTDLVGKGAYIALAQRKAVYLAGTSVRNFRANEAVGGFVELAEMGVR